MSPIALAALAWAGTGHALITPSRPAVGYARQHGARAWLLMQEGSEPASDKLSFTDKLVKGAQAAGEKLSPADDELSYKEKLEKAIKESGVNPAYWNRQFITASHIANNVPKGSVVLELGKDAKNLYYLTEPESATLIIPPSTQKINEGPIREAAAKMNLPLALYTETALDTIAIRPGTYSAALCFDMLDGAPEQAAAGAVSLLGSALKPGGRMLFLERERVSVRVRARVRARANVRVKARVRVS